jgi:putative ABC transport system permease protein
MRWRRYWGRSRRDDDLARELEVYLAQETADNIARGMSPDDARFAAQRKLGNVTRVRETVYDMHTLMVLDTLWRDLRYALRQLRLHPSFAIPAIVSLALGIGANTAVFQLLYALVMRDLPVARVEELTEIRMSGDGRWGLQAGRNRQFSKPLWDIVRDRQQAFSTVFAFADTRFNLAPRGEVRWVEGVWVSGNFFQALGVQPALGRLLAPEDDREGCGVSGAVISHAMWQRDYGGRPDIVGQVIDVNEARVPILGVTPATFFGVEVGRQFDLARPICAAPGNERRDHWWLAIVGRLKPDWTRDRATAQLQSLAPAIFAETLPPSYRPDLIPKYLAMRFETRDARTGVSPLRRGYAQPLWVLMTIAGLVLVIAAVNLANLMLARATTRTQEFAVRLAVGGSRARVVQQVMMESLVLAAAGALAGLVLAIWASQFIVSLIGTPGSGIFLDLPLDWRVLGFTATVAALSALVFGLVPALRAARAGAALIPGGRGTTATLERFRARRLLVAAQVGLSLVLLCAALLFTRSFRHLIFSETGLRQDGLVFAQVFLRDDRYPMGAGTRDVPYATIAERLRAIPGVSAVSVATGPPLSGSFSDARILIDGQDVGKANMNRVSPGYFQTAGIALRAGRDFDPRIDKPQPPYSVIVTEAFVRRYLGGGSPIGRIIARPLYDKTILEMQIVGVVEDSTYYSVKDEFQPLIFLSNTQEAWQSLQDWIVVRATIPTDSLVRSMNDVLRGFDPTASVRYRTFTGLIEESLVRERLMARLSSIFGILAVVLAVVGLYGVTSYTVARRTNEIGIRLALGASRGQIFSMMLGELSWLLASGLAGGLMLVLLLGRFVRTLLYGLDPSDMTTIASAMLVLALAACAAGLVPARRATRIDAGQSLRAL